MTFPLTLLGLAGEVALLLWGVHMVQTGVQRAFGARLRTVLAAALRRRFNALLAGIGVTAILQSSTATGLMVTGFTAAGLVDLVPALAVMLGANIGTTLIVQVLSFNVTAIAPGLVLLGVMLFRRAKAAVRDLGRVFIGLGLMLMALHALLDLLQPFEDAPSLRMLLGMIATDPLVAAVLAAGLTWAAHSSVAVVLLVMSLAAKGVVTPDAAFAMVLGANVGSAINPLLEGAGAGDPVARRLPLGNLLGRTVGALLALIAIDPLGRLMVLIEPNNARAVADFHTGFNVVLAILLFPLLRPWARLLARMLPARPDTADPAQPRYLDRAALTTPMIALGAATRESLRLSDLLETMLTGLRDAFQGGDRRRIGEMRRLDNVVDKLNNAIKAYVTALDPERMGEDDLRRVSEILAFITNLEQAADVVDNTLFAIASKKTRRGLSFSPEGQTEIIGLIDRLIANTRVTASLFMTMDSRAARELVSEKEAFRALEAAATSAHFDRLRNGQVESAETSSMHLDAVRALGAVNGQLIAAAAYPVLEAQDALLPSRLRSVGEE